MRFTGRDRSCDDVKRLTSSSLMTKKKKKNSFDNREDEFCTVMSATGTRNESGSQQIKKMGPIYKPRMKAAAVFSPSSIEEDVDLDKQLGIERFLDDKDYMWLSSDCASPSSFFEEYRLSGPFHCSIDDWLVSWLSTLANSYLKLGQGITPSPKPRINPTEEASSALQRIIPGAEKNLQEKGGVTLLFNSPGKDTLDSSLTSPRSAKSSGLWCCEDSTSCENSSTPLSTNLDSSSQISEFDRTSFWVSLVNLDGEDSKWISETESGLDYFQSGFPSPSYRSSCYSDFQSSNSSNSTPTEVKDGKAQCDLFSEPTSEAAELEDSNSDEPLFWPFERKFNWNSEDTWKYFSMSPRKDIRNIRTCEGTSPESIKLKLQGRKMNLKDGCKRRLIFSSGSAASKIIELKQRNNSNNNNKHNDKNNGIKGINSMPSRLRKSAKVAPLEMADDIAKPTDEKATNPKLFCMDRSFSEDDFASKEDLPIEKLLGLGEFDGHEGVDSEFNGDVFFLDDAL